MTKSGQLNQQPSVGFTPAKKTIILTHEQGSVNKVKMRCRILDESSIKFPNHTTFHSSTTAAWQVPPGMHRCKQPKTWSNKLLGWFIFQPCTYLSSSTETCQLRDAQPSAAIWQKGVHQKSNKSSPTPQCCAATLNCPVRGVTVADYRKQACTKCTKFSIFHTRCAMSQMQLSGSDVSLLSYIPRNLNLEGRDPSQAGNLEGRHPSHAGNDEGEEGSVAWLWPSWHLSSHASTLVFENTL